MLFANGPGLRAKAMHCRITSCFKFLTLRATLLNPSIKTLNVLSLLLDTKEG